MNIIFFGVNRLGLLFLTKHLYINNKQVTILERESPDRSSKQLRSLSWGPDRRVKHYKGCLINGYRFHTQDHDKYKKTQNSGIVVVYEHEQKYIDFYGELVDII